MSALLPLISVAKPWGRDALPPPFSGAPGQRIGEIWFEPPAALDRLLVKYIFTSEALSVQVHPSDAQTMAQGLGLQGKEECWLVVESRPDAKLAIGIQPETDADTIRSAALEGSVEALLAWHSVQPGDFFYIPAGTIHAIGAGISLIEIQQNSDITYRLYDYGRPRELHLDEGLAAAFGQRSEPPWRCQLPEQGSLSLVDGPHFRLDWIDGVPAGHITQRYAKAPLLVIPHNGLMHIGEEEIEPGQCGFADSIAAITFDPAGFTLVAQPIT